MVQKTPKAAAPDRKRRGRPRSYQPEVAIAAALDLFRHTGYAATSLDDLAAATGMNRPSLYGAFGDKRALYLKSYERYRDDYSAQLPAIFAADLDLATRLQRIYAVALDIYTSGAAPRGCFAVMTVASDAIADAEIAALMRADFGALDDVFARCFRKAAARGELPEGADIATLAQMAAALLNLLSIRARAGVPRAELDDVVQRVVAQLCG